MDLDNKVIPVQALKKKLHCVHLMALVTPQFNIMLNE